MFGLFSNIGCGEGDYVVKESPGGEVGVFIGALPPEIVASVEW